LRGIGLFDQTLGVTLCVINLGLQLLGVQRAEMVDYRLRGTITLDTLGSTLPFSRSGQFRLSAAGQGLLADAVTPTILRCTPGL